MVWRTVLILIGLGSAMAVAAEESLTVSAATSLTDPLTKIVNQYCRQHPQEITLSFGASGTLMAQIRRGAPVDLFISAADEQVQQLIKSGQADAASRRVLAGNSLVLITGSKTDAVISWSALTEPSVHKLAIGDPQNVPAGMYAMQTLRSMGIAEQLKNKLVFGENVRQVLVYVQLHEVDAGIVYHSDAVAARSTVHIVAAAPETAHDPIGYSAVILRNSAHHDAAETFLNYLISPEAKAF